MLLSATIAPPSTSLPKTRNVERYALDLGEDGGVIELLDTPGYSEAGPDQQQQSAIQQAVRAADTVLLVLDAHHPAREADRRLMDDLASWYAQHAEWKPPPVHCRAHPTSICSDRQRSGHHPTTGSRHRGARNAVFTTRSDMHSNFSATESTPSRRSHSTKTPPNHTAFVKNCCPRLSPHCRTVARRNCCDCTTRNSIANGFENSFDRR